MENKLSIIVSNLFLIKCCLFGYVEIYIYLKKTLKKVAAKRVAFVSSTHCNKH